MDSDLEKITLQQWYKPSGQSSNAMFVLQSTKSVLYYASKSDPEEVPAQWREMEEKLYDIFYKIMTDGQKAQYLQPGKLCHVQKNIRIMI